MNHIEAMKQAHQALGAILGTLMLANEQGLITDTIWFSKHETLFDCIASEADALRTTIEAAEKQEPVAWVVEDEHGERLEWAGDAHSCRGLPTTPPAAQPAPVQEPDCDRSVCGDFSPGPCDNPECPALRTTPPAAPVQELCFCDANGIGEPGVSCGDCPTRDYKKPPAAQPEQPASRRLCRDCADFGPICPNSGEPCAAAPEKGGAT